MQRQTRSKIQVLVCAGFDMLSAWGGSMAWWAWLLIGWITVALGVALLMAATARVIKQRERAGR